MRKLFFSLPIYMALLGGVPNQSAYAATDPIAYALSDIRVTCLFADAGDIDWPTIFYLNDRYGARVDLVSIEPGVSFRDETYALPARQLFWHRFITPDESEAYVDSVLSAVWSDRRADIILIGDSGTGLYGKLTDYVQRLRPDSSALFNVVRVFRRADADTTLTDSVTTVAFNRRELYRRYESDIRLDVARLSDRLVGKPENLSRLARYELVTGSFRRGEPAPDFVSGLSDLRLKQLVDRQITGSAARVTLKNRVADIVNHLTAARHAKGRRRAKEVITGYKALLSLAYEVQQQSEPQTATPLLHYLGRLTSRAQQAVEATLGIDWTGKIIVRDSPHGPRLKFRLQLSVDGPNELELSYVRFHPYWQEAPVIIDSVSRQVAPYQTFEREYFVDIDRQHLEAEMPESLLFVTDLVFDDIPLSMPTALPIWESPDLNIRFEPDFYFIPPAARVEVDRMAHAMHWLVMLHKPRYFSGLVRINLQTPRGLFAGAYRQDIRLDKGQTLETVEIPFSVSNLFELGVQRCAVTLSVDNRLVAADTAIIRIAECRMAKTVSIGFLPDSSGRLEDILRMSRADFRPLTERTLQTGNLNAYTVIVIGSGALRNYPHFRQITGRLESYLHDGGSLLLFGQPPDWPQELLPVAFVPSPERVNPNDILNRIPAARVLNRPYVISQKGLLSSLSSRQTVPAALVSPAEKVLVTPQGATLLSVSRIGDGQIIYCGLPLRDMIARLNIDAIHLLANLLNY